VCIFTGGVRCEVGGIAFKVGLDVGLLVGDPKNKVSETIESSKLPLNCVTVCLLVGNFPICDKGDCLEIGIHIFCTLLVCV